jgi:hypothetical protein
MTDPADQSLERRRQAAEQYKAETIELHSSHALAVGRGGARRSLTPFQLLLRDSSRALYRPSIAEEWPTFTTWATHDDALRRVVGCGALAEVEAALRSAYILTATSSGGRLKPSSVAEGELKKAGWKKSRVWVPDGFTAGDSFDGLKSFVDGSGRHFGVAVEIQWVWQGIYNDLLKFWRGARGGQAAIGIEVLRGPDAFNYIVHHVFALYQELLPDLRVVFCALEAADLRERFPAKAPREAPAV